MAGSPEATESPYRSRLYLTARMTLSGVHVKPGDPITYEEAVRQGIVDTRPPKTVKCHRCKGYGTYGFPKPKGHKPGCRCRFCQPCPVCEGAGVLSEPRGDG